MQRHIDFIFILVVASLVSFCGMAYELLLARFLATLSSDIVLAQSVTVGCFLLALGIGAYLYGRLANPNVWTLLAWVEVLVSFVAVVALPVIAYASIYVARPDRLIYGAQIATFAIGILSGLELPALIQAARQYTSKAFGWVLAANYVGALGASLLLPTILVPALGLYTTAWAFALLTAAIAGAVFVRSMRFTPSFLWPALAIAFFLPPWFSQRHEALEQFYLKSYYYVAPTSLSAEELRQTRLLQSQMPSIMRISSPYQEIDIVQEDLSTVGIEGPRGQFHMYLDQKNQFGSSTEAIYHDTMVHGAINLARKIPKRALVIGGGDGLIARELLRYPEIESITMIELDPAVIKLAKSYQPLVKLNARALFDPRVKVEVGDGYEWLRRSRDKFDALFIDLPHPVSIDLARLYSTEFYTFARRNLTDDGFMIFDFPFDGLLKSENDEDRRAVGAILASVEASGFKSTAALGFWESFLIATPAQRNFAFDYEALDRWVKDISVFNFAFVSLPTEKVAPNTIFKPTVLKVRLDGSG